MTQFIIAIILIAVIPFIRLASVIIAARREEKQWRREQYRRAAWKQEFEEIEK